MGLQEDFMKALKETEIHRHRQAHLFTLSSTELPYVLLCESAVNLGDTVVRKGVVRVEKPHLLLFRDPMEFEGFEYADSPNESSAFLALGRIVSLPPAKYSNVETKLEMFEGGLKTALDHYNRKLDQIEDVQTGLVSGPVDIWALCLFVYVGKMVARSAPYDANDLLRRRFESPWN
jgi:hypothetical protein